MEIRLRAPRCCSMRGYLFASAAAYHHALVLRAAELGMR